jgi:hypothetical protein
MKLDQASVAFGDALPGDHEWTVHESNGLRLPIRFRKANQADCLIVHFHGAVDREKRNPPIFQPFQNSVNAISHQLSISDPAMLRPGTASLGWYCGQAGSDLQSEIRILIALAARALDAKRLIFFGGSGGGYAALMYSWHFEGSIAVAVSPQTRLANHYPNNIKRYLESCWPGCASLEELPESVVTDVVQLYTKGHSNFVICLSSQGDMFHLSSHILPFICTLASLNQSQYVFECGYWGIPKHSGSVPHEAYATWLRACATAPSIDAATLIEHHHLVRSALKSRPPLSPKSTEIPLFSPADIQIADLLARLPHPPTPGVQA